MAATVAAPSTAVRTWSSIASRMACAINDANSDCDTDLELPENYSKPQSLKPARRGARHCLCVGEVLFMCGHYGWLATESDIDHPSAGMNEGRIYVHVQDVALGISLVQGDKVVFYLYVDTQGLGAEDCRLQRLEGDPSLDLNPHAAVFVPSTMPAAREAPSASPIVVPSSQTLDAFALNALAMQRQLMANWADLSDESDDSGDDIVAEIMAGGRPGDADGDVESNGERSCSEEVGGPKRRGTLVAIHRRSAARGGRLRKKKVKSSSSGGSSSTSVPASDSDGSASPPPLPPPGLRHPQFRPPPGLSLA